MAAARRRWWTETKRTDADMVEQASVLYVRSRSPISVPVNLNSYRLSSRARRRHKPDRLNSVMLYRSVTEG